MNGVLDITIGGEKRTLRFNNFAHTELSKTLFEAGHLVSTPGELLDKLEEMGKSNIMLLMKALVYAGLIGNDYEVGFKATVTPDQVGKWIGGVDEGELIHLWDVFLDAMGVNLSDLMRNKHPEEEGQPEEEEDSEKKSSGTQTSTAKHGVS